MAKERLDKVLGHMGVGTRREVKLMVKAGRVRVDGAVADDPGAQVDPEQQEVLVDGQRLGYRKHFYLMLHKPPGVITATEDPRKKTVMDVLPPEYKRPDLFPVGRLDRDTEGLLLLMTDGELCHRLLSPRWHVDKRYYVRTDRPLEADDPAAFAAGLVLEDGYACMPARLEILASDEAIVTIQEGKYHQVKRMFLARGKTVTYLKRLSMGPMDLGGLPLGAVRYLTEAETDSLYESAGLARP
ncbi:MAG TPA: pseudouridine synthase [Symbiobacteriaceae bacterium]|nr:pseudouridine synthase [Symbiobacteriaceae bacterium]